MIEIDMTRVAEWKWLAEECAKATANYTEALRGGSVPDPVSALFHHVSDEYREVAADNFPTLCAWVEALEAENARLRAALGDAP